MFNKIIEDKHCFVYCGPERCNCAAGNRMTKQFTMDDTLPKMWEECRKQDVELLFASDVGSHSWGFARETSDWDIKFLYKHNDNDKYLGLNEPMQHFSFKLDDKAEFVGYDIRKYLGLLLKGNANVYEMANSQYIFEPNANTSRSIRNFTVDALKENLEKVAAHFYGLAQSTYKQRVSNVAEPTSKKWLYIIRPLLCCEYIFRFNSLPPLEFDKLLTNCQMPLTVWGKTTSILEDRRNGVEAVYDMAAVEEWATEQLAFWKRHLENISQYRVPEDENPLTTHENFDRIYRELLNGRFRHPLPDYPGYAMNSINS